MKMKILGCSPLAAALAITALVLLPPSSNAQTKPVHQAKTKTVNEVKMDDGYKVDLKVLPAESFKGAKEQMTRDGGAKAVLENGPDHPNHHMVVFVKKNGKPVENARVSIRYRELSPKKGSWTTLPDAKMYATVDGVKSTHYGNNVRLAPGKYEARVIVNGSAPETFHFSL